jgi:hypothetical protein
MWYIFMIEVLLLIVSIFEYYSRSFFKKKDIFLSKVNIDMYYQMLKFHRRKNFVSISFDLCEKYGSF